RTTVTRDTTNNMTVTRQTDDLNRVIAETDELGHTTRFYYAGTNRQPTIVQSPDPARPLVLYGYDANGNVTRIDDPERGTSPTLFQYDAHNNLIQVTDARGFITKTTYNAFNQQTSMTRAFGTPL